MAFLKRADNDRYADLKLSIRDQFAFGINVYKTLNSAYDLLEIYGTSRNIQPQRKYKSPKDSDEREETKGKEEELQVMQFNQG